MALVVLAGLGGVGWWFVAGIEETQVPAAPPPDAPVVAEAPRSATETTRSAPPPEPSPPPAEAVAPGPPPALLALAPAPEPAARPAPEPPPLLSEAEILALVPAEPRMLRLRENPRVFVLLFPSLDAQAAALNRIAALVEKAGLPRDRVLDDAGLARAIERSGEPAATWYLGHDYSGMDLARFFALAERDAIALNAAERWVLERFREARALVPPESEVALISTANADHRMDPAMRAAILRHEVGHGHFFTRPDFAAHVIRVWRERFRERDRHAFRDFLGREGYDTTNETLMANEAMAYLLFTPDPRFFAARHVGMTEAEVARLRGLLREGMPPL